MSSFHRARSRREQGTLLDISRSAVAHEDDIAILDVDTDEDRQVGTRLGDYEILERIGSGATSCVYRARHVHERTEVAIKLLLLTPTTRRTHVQRMRREASVAGRIDHPNLIKIYEFG